MRHFLDINQLSKTQVEKLIKRAQEFKQGAVAQGDLSKNKLANLFYENSTRTRISFELAARQLAIPVINVDLDRSSEAKGEIIEDTIRTLTAMGINLFVIRHRQDKLPHDLAAILPKATHLINAGDGIHAHPSQALLDLMTILEHQKDLKQCKIAIVGNIRHSRVANSLQSLFSLMGLKELVLVAPRLWQPKKTHFGQVTDSLAKGLDAADVVICLRVQKERLLDNENMDLAQYRSGFALTAKSLALAKPDAIIMHPGPVNRGVEIDSEIVDGEQSVILNQVQNGVFMRMAIIESLL